MLRHPLTLDLIARHLNSTLKNAVLLTAWTQEKNACTLGWLLEDASEIYMHLSLDQDLGTVLLSPEPHRARRNTFDVFKQLIGQKCLEVTRPEGDRVLTFHCTTNQLHALFYSANAGNVIATESDGRIIAALHHSKKLQNTVFSIQPKPLQLGKYLQTLSGFEDDIIQAYRTSDSFYVLEQDGQALFSALPLPGWNVLEHSTDLFRMLRRAVTAKRTQKLTSTRVNDARKRITAELKKLQRTLVALEGDATKAASAQELREQASMLLSEMAPTKDMIAQAQGLFERARNAEAAAEDRAKRIPRIQARIAELEELLRTIPQSELATVRSTKPDQPDAPPPYRIFELPEGYVLYVGRNSLNNDQLTMRFAKQQDYWLHVRGHSGSHCILRAPNGAPPKPPSYILERAAEIAAYYSSARNATWTPVVYTLRKHVRKPKGSAPGAVVLEREDVIMVRPSLPNEQREAAQ